MAPTLTFHPLTPLVPPPSQDFTMQQMPNVFVHPPEEELAYNPPWCYFDATQAAKDGLCTDPDMDALNVALSLCQQTDNRAPAFRRTFANESQETVVMPRKGSFMKFRGMELELEMEEDGQPDIRSRGVRRLDEDVVEVVKYKRTEGIVDVGEGRKLKKTSTLRARATQAFRSIKNVGKANRDRRATVSERQGDSQNDMQAATLPTRHSCQDAATPRPVSPSLSRRRSLTLSQLFTSFKDKENVSSRPVSPADELLTPTSPTLVDSDSGQSVRPMSPTDSSSSHGVHPQSSPRFEDYGVTPSKSPNIVPRELIGEQPTRRTVEKQKSFVRRLSVLELQKLFSLGSSNPVPAAPPEPAPYITQDSPDDLFSPSQSRARSLDSARILSASSSQSSYGELPSRPSYGSHLSSSSGTDAEAEADLDLEMQLDSLHFDSLHFDPDEIMSSL